MTSIYEDAQLYDALSEQHFGGADFEFWRQLCAEAKGPVLELACGTGRLTILLAESGAEIEGLDASAPMMALAREKSEAQGQYNPVASRRHGRLHARAQIRADFSAEQLCGTPADMAGAGRVPRGRAPSPCAGRGGSRWITSTLCCLS